MRDKGAGEQPIIIIKKKGHGHGGHHGGAWKVAYADFVTAMMAFFLVMWIVGQGASTKAAVASYFRDPGAFSEGGGGDGVLPGAASGAEGGGANLHPDVATQALERAAEQIRAALAELPEFADLSKRIEVIVSEEGLRIELREAPDDGFFASGSAAMKPQTVEMIEVIAAQLSQIPNKIAVEGHTDSRPYSTGGDYTNWELSADRANAARRILVSAGVRGEQIEAVRGYADNKLRVPDQPFDPGNRRISIIVRRG